MKTGFGMLIGVMLSALTATLSAQQPDTENQSPREQAIRDFDRKAPKVGQPIPDLDLFDARGNPFSTAELRGRYTVLVFGCLT